jgi:hypothetical protein
MLEKILPIFFLRQKIVTDNTQAFKSMEMIIFFQKYNIVLGHSTPYYPQGNRLAESSNKILINIKKKLLTENKNSRHVHLKYALWENRIGTKKSIGMYPFKMVYGANIVLPINLSLPLMKSWQDAKEELNDVTRRINQIIEVQQNRSKLMEDLKNIKII